MSIKIVDNTRFFNVFVEIVIFFNIISNLMLILKKTHDLAIAIFDFFIFFFYICITILKFNLTIFTNFDFANFVNFNFLILNMLITNKKLRSFFYNTSILNKLNFNNSLIKYFSKNFAIFFD